MVGLFYRSHGRESNSPIVRMGSIAMLPTDRLRTGEPYGDMEAYWSKVNRFPGLAARPST